MRTAFEMFLWRGGVIAILVALAITGALTVRAFGAWSRTVRTRRRPVADTWPAENRRPLFSAQPADTRGAARDGIFREAA